MLPQNSFGCLVVWLSGCLVVWLSDFPVLSQLHRVVWAQMIWLILLFMVLAFLGQTLQLSSTGTSGSVLSSLGFTAAGIMAVLVSPNTFGVRLSSRSRKPLPFSLDNSPATAQHFPPANGGAGGHTNNLVNFSVSDAVPHKPSMPSLPLSPPLQPLPPAAVPAPTPITADETVAAAANHGRITSDTVPVAIHGPNDPLHRADALSEDDQTEQSDEILLAELDRASDSKYRAQVLWRMAKNAFIRAAGAAVSAWLSGRLVVWLSGWRCRECFVSVFLMIAESEASHG